MSTSSKYFKHFAGFPWFWVLKWDSGCFMWGPAPSRFWLGCYLAVFLWCAVWTVIAVLFHMSAWNIVTDILCTVYQLGYYLVRRKERNEYLSRTERAESAD